MIRAKLELKDLTDDEFIEKEELIVTKMGENAGDFPTPAPTLTQITTNAYQMRLLLNERAALEQQVQELTILIRAKRSEGTELMNGELIYVQTRANANTDPNKTPESIIVSGGMEPEDTPSTVGPLPKITGLVARQGDADGEIRVQWNGIRRGLMSNVIQWTADPTGQTGWAHDTVVTKSRHTFSGLTSGTRYWFRVAPVGAAGQGPWSDPATKVAP